ncbi:uncharacterized protein LOC121823285 [Peromyscus maniculatus bairdii]|uniref:uncharacterized protein LOC121823285 n=1 Tax=Peromyscus maniculatus bairdii TaxID=230844 RepID=UPI003FCF5EEF
MGRGGGGDRVHREGPGTEEEEEEERGRTVLARRPPCGMDGRAGERAGGGTDPAAVGPQPGRARIPPVMLAGGGPSWRGRPRRSLSRPLRRDSGELSPHHHHPPGSQPPTRDGPGVAGSCEAGLPRTVGGDGTRRAHPRAGSAPRGGTRGPVSLPAG